MSRLFLMTFATMITLAGCGGDGGGNIANKAEQPAGQIVRGDERQEYLRLTPAEFTAGTSITPQASFRQRQALRDKVPCPNPVSGGGAIIETNPHYDVAFITLDDAGKEMNTLTAPSTSMQYDRSVPVETWINHDFAPPTLPSELEVERLRVALRFKQTQPNGGGNACTGEDTAHNIVALDYRRTCAGAAGAARGSTTCRYVMDQ